MFTGIITEIGKARPASRTSASMVLAVQCTYANLALGESVAVDGVCLTVASLRPGGFVANVSAETLARSTLGTIGAELAVNLERALAVGDRLGGHIVAGHVDGVGKVVSREPVADAERWTLEAPRDVLRYLAEKGSVAVDGVSLTVNAVTPTSFEVMIVPFTQQATTLRDKRPGAAVNLEVDVLARYVARALAVSREDNDAAPSGGGLTLDLLHRAGFADR